MATRRHRQRAPDDNRFGVVTGIGQFEAVLGVTLLNRILPFGFPARLVCAVSADAEQASSARLSAARKWEMCMVVCVGLANDA
jgi:hypothetical protein